MPRLKAWHGICPMGVEPAAPLRVIALQVMRQITLFLAFFGFFTSAIAQSAITVSGNISEAATGETLPSALVILQSKDGSFSAITNPYGFYSLTVPSGASYRLKVNLIGYAQIEQNLGALTANRKVNVALKEEATQLGEVDVVSQRLNANVTTTEMSVSALSAKEIKKVPQLLGETDIIRTLTLLPGVSTVGEGASGFNVRGGNADQNLILLDEAPVYNSSHLFGFFSIFNADAVKDVKLYKGGCRQIMAVVFHPCWTCVKKRATAKNSVVQGALDCSPADYFLRGPSSKTK